MVLATGSKLGRYEVLAPIGAGGMGEVYRARDARLGRDVAIKVVPADRLGDGPRRRRFVQEARAASALNHPNIVTIHEIEHVDGIDFIVMELVPGRSLDTVIPRQGLRLLEALRIAVPIADALARAHAAGIVHRDLKPSNVVVGPEGVVKLLDFGLAKVAGSDEVGEGDDTLTEAPAAALSGPGTISGTPAYMSPEQASGEGVDSRSDIFSFGSLLYEMVTGRKAFAGTSKLETLAAVVSAEPKPPRALAAATPGDLEKLILRCLRKDPERRFQHIAEVRVQLQEIQEESISAAGTAAVVPRWKRPRRLALGAALMAVAIGAAWVLGRPRVSSLSPPRLVPLTAGPGTESFPTFSPDGSQVAFSWEGERPAQSSTANRDIWLKLIEGTEVRRLTTGSADDWTPSWSPDGRQIAFLRLPQGETLADSLVTLSEGTIHVVSPIGGLERRLSDFPAAFSQLAWSPDGRWIAARRARRERETAPEASGIHLVPLEGGEPRALTAPAQPGYDTHPAFSPKGDQLAYASCSGDVTPPCDVYLVDLTPDRIPSMPPRRLTRQKAAIHGLTWTSDGQSIVYALSTMYFHGRGMGSHLWRVNKDGGIDQLPERIESAREGAFAPAVAGSRGWLAFSQDRSDFDIYRFEDGRPAEPVVASSFIDYGPDFSPDGSRIVFESSRSGEAREIWLANADGSNAVQLTRGPADWRGPPRAMGTPSFSPDGLRIVFNARGDDGYYDLWTMDTEGGSLRRLTQGGRSEGLGIWSHDGRWIYYREDRSDGRDIARIAAAGGTGERITHNGALLVKESADGKRLFYTRTENTSALYSLPLAGGPEQRVVDCVFSRALAVGPGGIYYVGCSPGPLAPLYRLDTATGRSRLLGNLEKGLGVVMGLTVSPNGKTVLYGRLVADEADLMMIENFQ